MDKRESLNFLRSCIDSVDDILIDDFKRSYDKYKDKVYADDFTFCPPVHPEHRMLLETTFDFKISLDVLNYDISIQDNLQYNGLGRSIQQCVKELEIAA